jgi:tetratricopeptide (TPR) repeat protein
MRKSTLILIIFLIAAILMSATAQASSSDVEEIIDRANGFAKAGNEEEALAEIKRGLKLYPDSQELLSIHSSYLFVLGRYKEATLVSKQMLNLYPDFAEGHIFLALTFNKIGQDKDRDKALENAVSAYDNRIKQSPGDSNAKAQRAIVIHGLGRTTEASLIIKEMLLANPDDPEAIMASEILKDGGFRNLFSK